MFESKKLMKLEREQSVDDAENAIHMAREIFQRYSFDLIYARPNQTLESWELELRKAMNLAGDHISLYQLTIEKGTKFYQMYQKKEFYLPLDDDSNELYFLTDKILSEYGFNKYEVSNYARNDQGSIHNMCYWNYDDYLGIGPGAHSRLRQKFGNYYGLNQIYSPQSWLKSVKTNGNGIQKSELLSYKDAASELILMGLRLKCGIDQSKAIDKLESKIEDLIERSTLNFLKNEGLIEYNEKYFRATNNGWRILDYLIGKIIDGFKSYV